MKNSNLIEKILSEYIGRKVMTLEIEELGIMVSDNSLRDILKMTNYFLKMINFLEQNMKSFYLKSKVSAPLFEENIAEQESRRQFLGFLAGGLSVPLNLVEKEFKKENQIKKIKYINLEEYYSKFKPSNTKVEKFFKDNKEIFIKKFKSIKYAEISSNISGNNEYDENFFRQLDIIENKVLDGQSFESASEENDLKIISISKVDKDKKDLNKNLVKNLPDNLFDKIYSIKKKNLLRF